MRGGRERSFGARLGRLACVGKLAARAYKATGDLLSVQELLGHASPETTLAYVMVAPVRLRAVVMAAA